jgi:hypothetical protein
MDSSPGVMVALHLAVRRFDRGASCRQLEQVPPKDHTRAAMSVPQREQRTQPAQRELATQGGEERGIAILSETAWTILIKFQRLSSFAFSCVDPVNLKTLAW